MIALPDEPAACPPLSSCVQRGDQRQLVPREVFRVIELVMALRFDPDFGRGAEELSEPEGGVRRHQAHAVNDLADPTRRHIPPRRRGYETSRSGRCPRPSHRSQVPRRIHPLMQDANHIHAIDSLDVEQQVAPDAVPTVPRTNPVAGATAAGIG